MIFCSLENPFRDAVAASVSFSLTTAAIKWGGGGDPASVAVGQVATVVVVMCYKMVVVDLWRR